MTWFNIKVNENGGLAELVQKSRSAEVQKRRTTFDELRIDYLPHLPEQIIRDHRLIKQGFSFNQE
jgi:hypothetical protein